MKCNVCGTENPDNAKFCGICGTPFAASAAAEAENDPSTYEIPAADTDSDGDADTERPAPESDEADAAYEPSAEFTSTAEASLSDAADTRYSAAYAPAPVAAEPKRPSFSAEGAFIPVPNTAPRRKRSAGRHEKEKKVVSLSVAVFCIIAVFILSVICGILTQLYLSKNKSLPRSGMSYSDHEFSREESMAFAPDDDRSSRRIGFENVFKEGERQW